APTTVPFAQSSEPTTVLAAPTASSARPPTVVAETGAIVHVGKADVTLPSPIISHSRGRRRRVLRTDVVVRRSSSTSSGGQKQKRSPSRSKLSHQPERSRIKEDVAIHGEVFDSLDGTVTVVDYDTGDVVWNSVEVFTKAREYAVEKVETLVVRKDRSLVLLLLKVHKDDSLIDALPNGGGTIKGLVDDMTKKSSLRASAASMGTRSTSTSRSTSLVLNKAVSFKVATASARASRKNVLPAIFAASRATIVPSRERSIGYSVEKQEISEEGVRKYFTKDVESDVFSFTSVCYDRRTNDVTQEIPVVQAIIHDDELFEEESSEDDEKEQNAIADIVIDEVDKGPIAELIGGNHEENNPPVDNVNYIVDDDFEFDPRKPIVLNRRGTIAPDGRQLQVLVQPRLATASAGPGEKVDTLVRRGTGATDGPALVQPTKIKKTLNMNKTHRGGLSHHSAINKSGANISSDATPALVQPSDFMKQVKKSINSINFDIENKMSSAASSPTASPRTLSQAKKSPTASLAKAQPKKKLLATNETRGVPPSPSNKVPRIFYPPTKSSKSSSDSESSFSSSRMLFYSTTPTSASASTANKNNKQIVSPSSKSKNKSNATSSSRGSGVHIMSTRGVLSAVRRSMLVQLDDKVVLVGPDGATVEVQNGDSVFRRKSDLGLLNRAARHFALSIEKDEEERDTMRTQAQERQPHQPQDLGEKVAPAAEDSPVRDRTHMTEQGGPEEDEVSDPWRRTAASASSGAFESA
ncbi:unnamed protein product, partial [Amoebophrya sp. A25]